MIPKLIHQTAPSKNITPEEQRVLRHNRKLMKGWEFRLWDDSDNMRLMAEAFPRHIEKYSKIKRGVVKADIARCMYLYLFGGWYLDTDYKILRPFESDILKNRLVLPVSGTESDRHLVCNSVMASEPKHPFWEGFIDMIFSIGNLSELDERSVEKTTGPVGLSQFYLNNEGLYGEICLPPKHFFHPRVTMMGFSYDKSYPSYGVHFCWGSWRSKSILRSVKNYVTRKGTSF